MLGLPNNMLRGIRIDLMWDDVVVHTVDPQGGIQEQVCSPIRSRMLSYDGGHGCFLRNQSSTDWSNSMDMV